MLNVRIIPTLLTYLGRIDFCTFYDIYGRVGRRPPYQQRIQPNLQIHLVDLSYTPAKERALKIKRQTPYSVVVPIIGKKVAGIPRKYM